MVIGVENTSWNDFKFELSPVSASVYKRFYKEALHLKMNFPGLTAMVKHNDHAMAWYDHGDLYSPWYDHGLVIMEYSMIMLWWPWNTARVCQGDDVIVILIT